MQNDKRYWLRGGIIFLAYSIAVSYLLFLSNVNLEHAPDFVKLVIFILEIPYWIYSVWLCGIGINPGDGLLPSCNTSPIWQFVRSLPLTVLFFMIGSMFGWLYGKIKNRKKDT